MANFGRVMDHRDHRTVTDQAQTIDTCKLWIIPLQRILLCQGGPEGNLSLLQMPVVVS